MPDFERSRQLAVARIVAKAPRPAQVLWDRAFTETQLPKGRNLLLPTNGNAPEGRTALDFVADGVRQMVEGQVVLVVAYSGRNATDKAPHTPETGQDFKQASDVTKKKLDPFNPAGYIFLHEVDNKAEAILRAKVLYFAGGNTAGHVANLMGLENYDKSPIDNVRGANTKPLQYAIRSAVAAGTPYIGVSAGEMIAAAHTFLHLDPPAHVHIQRNRWGEMSYTLNNTGLNLLGNSALGIEPHAALHQDTNYLDETRYDRLHQVVERMHWIQALLTRNESALVVTGNRMSLVGDATSGGHLLTFNTVTRRVQTMDIPVGADLSYLLDTDRQTTPAQRFSR